MSTSTRGRTTRQTILGAAAAVAVLPLLAGCVGGAPADDSVNSIEGVKAATVLFEGQGTFIEPWTVDPAESAWVGTGWFMSPDGYVVTNNHVVTGAGTLRVSIGGDGEPLPARVVAASECFDLAVVKVDVSEPVPHLAWFDGTITEGIEAYSAGYPLALGAEYTLTKGIVSQADTSIATPWADVEHAIQHDARIRGGNSGGPLVNESGKVLGVNYAGNDQTDENIAISREDALPTVAKLLAGENVLSLGLNLQANPPLEDGTPDGLWVASVKPGGPADLAGIKPGDVIDRLGGVTMSEDGTLRSYCDVLRTNGTDATMTVEVYRPSTDEVLEGQINGSPIVVVRGGNGTGQTPAAGSFVEILNDEGNMTMRVPDTWSQVDGSPIDGGFRLEASPNLAAYASGFDVPGATMYGYTGTGDARDALSRWDSEVSSLCTADQLDQPYADGAFTGFYSYFSACAGTNTEVAVLVVNADSGSGFIELVIQMVDDFDKGEVLDNILASFNANL